ncbi:MAG TPA: altronate dehydratase family protein [Terriglobales bacterium]|nr:altronate dehydratase family protein [Terriglobales bacterium]
MRNTVLKLDSRDNVLIALRDLRKGDQIAFSNGSLSLASDVPAKHKFATENLAPGGNVIMYGVLVGKARESIAAGQILTTRNLAHEAAPFHESSHAYAWTPPDVGPWWSKTFLGYPRKDGQVGTRNYWLVAPLVFCENRNIGAMKRAFEEELGFAPPPVYRRQLADLVRRYRNRGSSDQDEKDLFAIEANPLTSKSNKVFENVDGIKFLMHEGGCGGTREDSDNLCGLIAGYIHHPNVAGATVLSLGCQHSQTAILRDQLKRRDPLFNKPLLVLEQQQSGSEFNMLSKAIEQTFLGLTEANKSARVPAGIADLCIGLKCGGSDGFSGISANPAIGYVSDMLAALGGRSILSEFPELCGVEQGLIDRSINKEVGDRFIQLMRDYAARARAVRSGFDMNPSPGNIRDGLITDAMKSAGAARKGGTSPVTAVLDYPEYSTRPGLNLQCTPGNDVECVTAQVGAGASIVLFTTGLGTPTGNPIAPVVKISTNSELAKRMEDIIDIDTGPIVTGEQTQEEMGTAILERVIEIASGKVRTKAELLNQDDFIPWKRGVSL